MTALEVYASSCDELNTSLFVHRKAGYVLIAIDAKRGADVCVPVAAELRKRHSRRT